MCESIHPKRSRDWSRKSAEAAEDRAAEQRWSFRSKARVIHPTHGEVIVPCASGMAAIYCAAEVWGVPWETILDAKVMACDQNLPAVKRPEKKKPVTKTWMVIHLAYGFVDVLAEDAAGAIWAAAKVWGKDPKAKEFHQNCTVRMRR